jgi:hypothetical protein
MLMVVLSAKADAGIHNENASLILRAHSSRCNLRLGAHSHSIL